MNNRSRFVWRSVSVLVLLLLFVSGAPVTPAHATDKPSNVLSDSEDVYIYGLETGNRLVEGWLTFSPDPKDPANKIGTFSDNYSGGKRYPASYIGATQQLTLNTAYGRFVFDATGRMVSYPTRFGSGRIFYYVSQPHGYTIQTFPSFSLDSQSDVGLSSIGQMTLTLDVWRTIVPDNPKTHVQSRIVGTTGGKPFVAPITQIAVLEPTEIYDATDALVFSTKIGKQTFRFQSYRRQNVGAWGVFDGFAYADGSTKHGVIYRWHME